MTGVELIAAERRHQVDKGYDAAHDDGHANGEMAAVAGDLALNCADCVDDFDYWPDGAVPAWADPLYYNNRGDRVRMLAVAGALIAAEIDRLHRKAEKEA